MLWVCSGAFSPPLSRTRHKTSSQDASRSHTQTTSLWLLTSWLSDNPEEAHFLLVSVVLRSRPLARTCDHHWKSECRLTYKSTVSVSALWSTQQTITVFTLLQTAPICQSPVRLSPYSWTRKYLNFSTLGSNSSFTGTGHSTLFQLRTIILDLEELILICDKNHTISCKTSQYKLKVMNWWS